MPALPRAVSSRLVLARASAPRSSSSRTAGGLPLDAATISAVSPALSLALTAAFASSRRRIASTSPRPAAAISGVRPLAVRMFGSAPLSSRSRRMAWPSPSDGRQIQRRAAFGLLCVHARAAGEQQAHLGFVVDRPMQRRRSTPVRRIHIRAGRRSATVIVSSVPKPAAWCSSVDLAGSFAFNRSGFAVNNSRPWDAAPNGRPRSTPPASDRSVSAALRPRRHSGNPPLINPGAQMPISSGDSSPSGGI